MRLYVFFVTLFTLSKGDVDITSTSNDDQISLNETICLRVRTDLTYHFYSQLHLINSIDITTTTLHLLKNTDFQAERDSLFIFHGWQMNKYSYVSTIIRETILQQNDINVFVVDWSPIAGRNYFSAMGAVKRVGHYVADFIRHLKLEYGLEMSKIRFVGFSLGAHVAGNAGARLLGKVQSIVGLDPAGTLFWKRNIHNRLDASDAKFVEVIHTSSLGFGSAIGHADYFPNGGRRQNGCGWDIIGTCAHSRAYDYYAESLKNRNFVATKCESYSSYTIGHCSYNEKSVMGGFKVDSEARGMYFLTTNSVPPFAKSE